MHEAPVVEDTVERRRIVSATGWVALLMGVGRASLAAQAIFVSRVFGRDEVGLVAVLLVMQRAIHVFTEMGHETALIQQSGDRLDGVIDTAWVSAIGRGLLLTAALALASGPIAAFYERPELTPLIRGMAVYFAIIGFKSLHLVHFTRTLQLARPKVLMGGSMVLGFVVTVVVGLATYSIWCVVIGAWTQGLVEVIGSHLLAPKRSRFRFHTKDFKVLFRYGRNIQAVAILVFLVTQLDDAVVGKVVSVEALGVYVSAYFLANLPMTMVVSMASQVAMPTWAKVARDGTTDERNAMFISTIRLTLALSVSLSIALFVGGADFIELVLGAKWRDAEGPMRVLILFGLWRAIGSNFGALFNSIGRPDLILREIALKVIVIAATIYPMTSRWGIVGAAWSVTLPMLIISPIACWLYLGIAQVDRRRASRALAVPAAFAALSLGVWRLVVTLPMWTGTTVLVRGSGGPVLALIFCLGGALLVDREIRRLVWRALRSS